MNLSHEQEVDNMRGQQKTSSHRPEHWDQPFKFESRCSHMQKKVSTELRASARCNVPRFSAAYTGGYGLVSVVS